MASDLARLELALHFLKTYGFHSKLFYNNGHFSLFSWNCTLFAMNRIAFKIEQTVLNVLTSDSSAFVFEQSIMGIMHHLFFTFSIACYGLA